MAAPVVLGLVALGLGITSALGGIFPPLGRLSSQSQNSGWKNEIPDIVTCATLYAQGIIDHDKFLETMAKHGIDENWASNIAIATQNILSPMDYITLYRRGELTREQLGSALTRQRIPDFLQELYLKAAEFFPSPQDLVTFAVREVYTPETVRRFGQMEDLPQEFIENAFKAGLPEEQAKNYWAAHWQLPSASQGFEMFQRGVIDRDTLYLLLKSLDLMPFWRDKLTEISYNPLTRVDVRRMYSLGVLEREDVYKSYLDAGYSPDNAKRMTDFTVLYENQEVNGISRANVLSAYKDDIISENQLVDMLGKMGYIDSVIEFWVSIATYEKTEAEIKLITDDLVNQYRLGMLDEDAVQLTLNQYDLPDTYVKSVLRKMVIQKAEKAKIVSKEDVLSWLYKGVIDEEEFHSKMRLLGYMEEDILRYLSEASFDEDRSKRKFLSDTIYIRWYVHGIVSEKQFIDIYQKKGMSESDIEHLIDENKGARLEYLEQLE